MHLSLSLSTDLRPVIAIAKESPAAPGDLVLVQIDMQTSVEGDRLRKNNSSYLSWKAPFLPAIIVKRILNMGGRYHFGSFLLQT
jgi:hypothetical protein